ELFNELVEIKRSGKDPSYTKQQDAIEKKMTLLQLKEEARRYGASTSGNKAQIIISIVKARDKGKERKVIPSSVLMDAPVEKLKKGDLQKVLFNLTGSNLTGDMQDLKMMITVARQLKKPPSPFVFKNHYSDDDIYSYDLFNLDKKYLQYMVVMNQLGPADRMHHDRTHYLSRLYYQSQPLF